MVSNLLLISKSFSYRVWSSMLYFQFRESFQWAVVSSCERKCTLDTMIIVMWRIWRGRWCCRSIFDCITCSTVVWIMTLLRSNRGRKWCHRRWRRRCWRWDSWLSVMRNLFPYCILLLVSCFVKLDCINDSLIEKGMMSWNINKESYLYVCLPEDFVFVHLMWYHFGSTRLAIPVVNR